MAIPYTFARIKPQDVTLTPFPTHKYRILSSSEAATTQSGYFLWDALYSSMPTPIGSNTSLNDPTNSIDNSYQHTIWKQIDALWYRYPYDSTATLEHANRRYTYKFLNYSASQLSIPYFEYGEAIKNNSVLITNTTYNYTLQDDVNGNLYDPGVQTGSYAQLYSLVGYWGFNNAFRKFRYRNGTVVFGSIGYTSRTFEPDNHSEVSNVRFDSGVPISGSLSGMCAEFDGNGYIMTDDRPEFNFPTNEDFTISAWVKLPISQSILSKTTNSIISKRGVVKKLVYGVNDKYSKSDTIVRSLHVSSSTADELTDIYPYDVEVYNTGANNGKIVFRRSDGKNILSLTSTSSLNDGQYHHFAITKENSNVILYVDGVAHSSGSDLVDHPINKHSLMFGSVNRSNLQGYSGSLDEVRIYDYGASAATVRTLADNITGSLYQTAIVGNVFYRSGNIIVSPLNPKYQTAFRGNWTLAYRGTHTIYQYEILVRVKAASFNITMNPTARRSPKSDLLIDEFTGSNEILTPYITEIGLYSNGGDLIGVAKLGQPVATRSDVDINFLIRMDV